MKNLAVLFKALNLYAHMAHNSVKGPTFFEDHEYLNELYDKYDSEYDDVVERMIGLNQPVDFKFINSEACKIFDKLPVNAASNSVYFQEILKLEKILLDVIKSESTTASIGTQQLIGEQANQSEMRIYKLQQRLKK